MASLGTTMALAAGGLLVLWVATWALSLALRDASIADVVWGLAFVLTAWIAYAVGGGEDSRGLLAAVLTSVWGLRLAVHIGARKRREGEEDRRYREIRERVGDGFTLWSLPRIFLLQGAVAWIVSLPLFAAAAGTGSLGALSVAGAVVWVVGFGFEAIGDAQLARFGRDSANRGRVMDRGLWRYTRHPNYFGDVVVWCGMFLIGLDAGGWWAAVSPALMAYLLVRVTGKEMLERHLSKREGYADYVERTSGFVPLPPRSKAARRT
ncbi:DUF1295 domain-containing protein [Thermoleophilia bacterium SCSIO 60948]|nr:DUF1295 domain-containing protein [Thermoleophilia bacterium SCSIO 60948]